MKKLSIVLLLSLFVCQNSSTMFEGFENNEEEEILAPLPQTVNNLTNNNNGIPQEVIFFQIQQQQNQRQKLTEEEQMRIAIAQSLEESTLRPQSNTQNNQNQVDLNNLAEKILTNPSVRLQELSANFSIEQIENTCQNLGYMPEKLAIDITLERSREQLPQMRTSKAKAPQQVFPSEKQRLDYYVEKPKYNREKVDIIKMFVESMISEKTNEKIILKNLKEYKFKDHDIAQALSEINKEKAKATRSVIKTKKEFDQKKVDMIKEIILARDNDEEITDNTWKILEKERILIDEVEDEFLIEKFGKANFEEAKRQLK